MLWLSHSWIVTSFLAQATSSADATTAAASGIINLISLAAYVFTSYCLYNMFKKLGEPNAWFAWVPFLQNWMMYKAGDQSPWWIIGLFIPFVNIAALVVLIIAFVNIVKKLGKNPWLIWLMLIPIVNLVVMYNFAFG